jgi:phosphoribosylglycinamide formyltransferase-1
MTEAGMRVVVFASGRGSDFEALVKASRRRKMGWKVVLLITNNPEAGAIEKAGKLKIPCRVINRADFPSGEDFLKTLIEALDKYQANFIALAGYLRKIPPALVLKFKNRIVNIHPALLPGFGGKGMYGSIVHQSVLEVGCKMTGVTVHLVDEEYDRGPIVAQRAVVVAEDDNAETLAARVLKVEHRLYPEVLTLFAQDRVQIQGRQVKIVKR